MTMEWQPRNDPADPRKRLRHATAAEATKGAHPRAQAPRSLRAGRREHPSVLRAPEDTNPRGQNSPPPALRPRHRGHFGDTPWLPPGGGPKPDSQVPARSGPAWARDSGSPGGERGSSTSKFVAGWAGCGRAWGPAPGAAGVGTWCSQGAGAGRLLFGANSRISLGNQTANSFRSRAARRRGPLPALLASSGAVGRAEGHRGRGRTRGGQPPAPGSVVSSGPGIQNRFLPAF